MIIVKLGGSVITNKKGSHAFRKNAVLRLARELKKAKEPFIVVLGGGGKAHALAKKYGFTSKRAVIGTRQSYQEICSCILKQQEQVCGIFKSINIDARLISLSTSRIPKQKTGVLVFSGDILPAGKGKYRILSGDTIAIELAKLHKASKVIFLTDVDGVLLPNGKLWKNIFTQDIKRFLKKNAYKSSDVTGELPGKLKVILKKPKNCKVFIINGLKAGRLLGVLAGKKTIGTQIK